MKVAYLLSLLVFAMPLAFANIGFEPVYQPASPPSGDGPAEKYCTLGDFLNSYNSTTHIFTCLTPSLNSALKIFNQTALPDYFITGINNSTGVITTNQFSINSNTCSGSDFVSSLDNVTGFVICSTPSSSGFTKIVSAPATTAKILAENSTGTAVIKPLTQSTGITLTNNTNEIVIATTPGAFKNPLLDGSNHTDTTSSSPPNRGDLITGNPANLWDDLPIGVSGTVLKSDGTDASWGTVSTPTVLAANVTSSLIGSAHTLLWTIPLTANSGNSITGIIVGSSDTSGSALQYGANTTNANSNGFCKLTTPTSATAEEIDYLLASTANVVDTGATTWLPTVQVPQPLFFDCTINTGSTAGSLRIFIQAEVASTVKAAAGSFYIKTP